MKNNFNAYQRIVDREDLFSELTEKIQDRVIIDKITARAIIGRKPNDFDPKKLKEQLEKKDFNFQPLEEAIINVMGRPVLEITNNSKIDWNEPELDFWKQKLKSNQLGIEKAIESIGRIELEGHPKFSWVGTGWLYKDEYIITNRHVAKEFARRKGNEFVFKRTFWGEEYGCKIDFREEYKNKKVAEYIIDKVVHIEADNGPDIAIMKIKWESNNAKFPSLELMDKVTKDRSVATIGYPARDSRTNIPEEQVRIFSNIFNKKRLAIGEIDYVDPNKRFFVHDCTTLGGNSGSPVIDIETQKVYGLHFSGKEGKGNFAVSSELLGRIINNYTNKTFITMPRELFDFEEEKRITKGELKSRNGFNEDFLNKIVPLPELSKNLEKEVARLIDDDKKFVLNYTNYSVIMSKEKRLGLVAAVNIDGSKWRKVTRGSDSWHKDPRILKKHQVGNELYKYNKLDRGHLVRRLDPAWGDSFKEAKFASEDTFFYTNCAPQHKKLNQDIWLELEDYILENTANKDIKVCVFNGPIFTEDDIKYRGVQIPESFWKVVVTNIGSTKLHTTAYILSQKQWLDDIEFVFGAYKTYQVPISIIEEKTGLKFHKNIVESDPFYIRNEAVFDGPKVTEIKMLSNIIL